jgi:hypothetical protein
MSPALAVGWVLKWTRPLLFVILDGRKIKKKKRKKKKKKLESPRFWSFDCDCNLKDLRYKFGFIINSRHPSVFVLNREYKLILSLKFYFFFFFFKKKEKEKRKRV